MTVVKLGSYQQATAKRPDRPFQQISRSLALTKAYSDAIAVESQQFIQRLAVGVLSAITADMGTLTAGRIIMASTTHIFAIGVGFGSANQFLMWYGPRPTADNLALCQDSSGGSFPGIFYIKTSGSPPVETQSIADFSVITQKLADLGVTTGKLADLAISTAKLADSSVVTTKLNNLGVTTAKLADLAVSTAKIIDGNITAAKIAAHTITANEIAALTITAAEIAALTITGAKIAAAAIDATKIAAHTITANEIAALTITAAEIAALTITGAKIAAGTITAANIAANAITADKINATQITVAKLTTGQLNRSNHWPNPTSEISPPGSYVPPDDGTDPEFDFRHNAGAPPASFAGTWVRRLLRTTAGTTQLRLRVPVTNLQVNTEPYAIYHAIKYVQTGGTPTAKTKIQYLDASLAVVRTDEITHSTGQTTWGRAQILSIDQGTGAVYVDFIFELVTATSGTAEIWFDGINATRMINVFELAVAGTGTSTTPAVGASAGLVGTDDAISCKLFQTEDWIAPTLLNSWVNFGAGGQSAKYYRDTLGTVHLRGLVKGGTPGSTSVIFNLPAGYRPVANLHFAVASNALFGFCRVDSNGDVIAFAGSSTWFSLDGITFDARS